MVFSRAQIEAMLAQWIPNAHADGSVSNETPNAPLRASQTNARYSETLVEAAIAAWNETHQTEVEQAVAKCTRSGRHYSTRPDDKTPSTVRVSADAWRDFGQQPAGPGGKPLGVMDPLEMHLRLNPHLKKQDFIWSVVVPEYRAQKSADAGR